MSALEFQLSVSNVVRQRLWEGVHGIRPLPPLRIFKPFPFSPTCLSTALEHIKKALIGCTWSWTSQSHELWENKFLFSIKLSSVEYSVMKAENRLKYWSNQVWCQAYSHLSRDYVTKVRLVTQGSHVRRPGEKAKHSHSGAWERIGKEREKGARGKRKRHRKDR